MKTTWIEQALSMGGQLSVRRIWRKPEYRAEMEWFGPDHQRIVSDPCSTMMDAIENLNNALMEDAADEMVRQGAV